MSDAFSLRLTGDIGESLRQYAEDVKQKALRPAAYAMASVFYTEMRMRVPVYTGLLRDSIYHWHDDKRSTADRQIYAIGPNKKKAPHWHLVEYGTVKMAARPYVRPTYDSKVAQAIDAGRARMAQKLEELSSE